MKKLLVMLLALTMVLSLLSACGKKDSGSDAKPAAEEGEKSAEESEEAAEPEQENINGLVLPITEEKTELSVLTVYESALITDPNEIKGNAAMEERTNVHINWQVCGQTEMLERFQVVLSTGEYPDILIPAGTNVYPGGYEQGIADGVLVDMDPLTEYMPNYMLLVNSDPEVRKMAAYDDGKFHGIKTIQGTDTEIKGPGAVFGPTYRSDLLEKMGEELPTTIEGWHQLLIKCRDAGMTAPMTLESDGGTALSLAWGVNTDWSTNYWQYDYSTGTVTYSPLVPAFEDWLKTMRDWYAEDLIDKNFTAGAAIITGDYSNIENDQTMLFDIWFGFQNGTFLHDAGFVSNENVYMQGFPGVSLEEGGEVIKCVGDSPVGQELFVTTAVKDPVIAAKWLDYCFTQESADFRYYGIEGESYTIENGEKTYTDAILHPEGDLTPSDQLGYYAMRTYGIGYSNQQAGDRLSIATSPNGRSAQIESIDLWASPEKSIHLPAGVALNAEESELCNQYMTDIQTLVQEYMVKFIIGEDTTPYSEFVEKLKSYHVDECVACWQAAADRYNAR